MSPDKLYRVEMGYDGKSLRIDQYSVVKVTPKGYRLWHGKFVLASGNKRFAYPTQEEAMQSYLARKRRQILITAYQLKSAELGKDLAEAWLAGERPDTEDLNGSGNLLSLSDLDAS